MCEGQLAIMRGTLHARTTNEVAVRAVRADEKGLINCRLLIELLITLWRLHTHTHTYSAVASHASFMQYSFPPPTKLQPVSIKDTHTHTHHLMLSLLHVSPHLL